MRRYLLVLGLAACAVEDRTASSRPVMAYACIDSVLINDPPPPPVGGGAAFVTQCGQCHSSRDGTDLAFFSYSDTNIVRRALGHVDTATAWSIAAYIASLNTPHFAEQDLLFQPGGGLVPGGITTTGDVAFAVQAFGSDAWPATYTRANVMAIDPRTVRIALPLLPWSEEAPDGITSNSNLEWLPKDSLPLPILTFNGNAAGNALAAYYAAPSITGLEAFTAAVVAATKAQSNSIAPCSFNSATRVNYAQCFEIHRWVASLSAVHKLKQGGALLSPALYLQWWDVGDVARRARIAGLVSTLPNAFTQWARWMYLGWLHDPINQPCIYTAEGQIHQRLPRHGVFICLRSIVARAPGDFLEDTTPYQDFRIFARVTPAGTGWAFQGGRFALTELQRRLNAGDQPPVSQQAVSLSFLDEGMSALQGKVSAAEFATLSALANAVRAGVTQ